MEAWPWVQVFRLNMPVYLDFWADETMGDFWLDRRSE
jgi:hypothetical protein